MTGQFHGLLLIVPVFLTAVFPLGKILRTHRPPAELFRDNALHFRQAVQPCDQFRAALTVRKPLVQFIANGLGQPRYFSISSDVHKKIQRSDSVGFAFGGSEFGVSGFESVAQFGKLLYRRLVIGRCG